MYGFVFHLRIDALAIHIAEVERRFAIQPAANRRAGQQRGKGYKRIFLLLQRAGAHTADFSLRGLHQAALQHFGITVFHGTAYARLKIHRDMKRRFLPQLKHGTVQIGGAGRGIVHK